MALKFNPFTGTFDFAGSSGGGGSAFFAGEVATYADLPLDGSAALNSRWLVRSASGVWPFPGYHQGGIYVRVSTAGVDRATDYLLADTNFPDVFSDAAFTVYDDADSTRSMQIEVTDNETLTFKVTGTDSVVRSVAFALSAIVLAALMASSALAQNIGLVTDTNGNIVTRRTNELVWSNNLRFTPLTNADSRTAIIGTNGALSAGNPPSGAAANGALLAADGAGGSSFVSYPYEDYGSYATNHSIISETNFVDVDGTTIQLPQSGSYHIQIGWRSVAGDGGWQFRLAFDQLITQFGVSGTFTQVNATAVLSFGTATNTAVFNTRTSAQGISTLNRLTFIATVTSNNVVKLQFRQNTSSTNATTIQESFYNVRKLD